LNFEIDDKKQRSGQASWVTGSSPPRYATTTSTSFKRPEATNGFRNLQDAIAELKARITTSKVMQNLDKERENSQAQIYQTHQQIFFKSFGSIGRPDLSLISEQKERLS
jgi:hypothetical protein